jgi:hypothetical protein
MTREELESSAWSEYLRTCRDATAERYDVIEPWAWSRLERRLVLIRRAADRARVKAKAIA